MNSLKEFVTGLTIQTVSSNSLEADSEYIVGYNTAIQDVLSKIEEIENNK